MSPIHKVFAFGALVAALFASSQASAGNARAGVDTPSQSQNMTAPGFATAEASISRAFAQANAYEFNGGLGVSAFARAKRNDNNPAIAQASSAAAFGDSFRIADTSGLLDLSDTVFLLNIPILVSGEVSTAAAPFTLNPNVRSFASASYRYDWTVGGQSGGGFSSSVKDFTSPNAEIRTVNGPAGASILVSLGDLVSLNFSASAQAGVNALAGGGADATADFGHTLRWGGVTSFSAMDHNGNAIDLPDGFRLSLVSDATGFDYWNAAGPNPFVANGVPEPASWALMILGFGGMGAVLRRRRPALQPA